MIAGVPGGLGREFKRPSGKNRDRGCALILPVHVPIKKNRPHRRATGMKSATIIKFLRLAINLGPGLPSCMTLAALQ